MHLYPRKKQLSFFFIEGKTAPVKCKREASAPRLIDFIEVLKNFRGGTLMSVQVVTDDSRIQEEISRISNINIEFIKPEPAPQRIPDKVRY